MYKAHKQTKVQHILWLGWISPRPTQSQEEMLLPYWERSWKKLPPVYVLLDFSRKINAKADVPTLQSLGFKAISGDVKLRLFPSPWPADRSPPTTSSLLSVSSIRGLLAAAGPDTLVVASTDTVRKTFSLTTGEDNTNNLKPELSIPVPRLSHVAFTSDGSCLIIAAEQGGGLAIHSVDNLLKNNSTPVIELTTEGVAIRALVPNPAKDLAHLVAVVMSNGHLMIANLQERAFARGLNNQPSLKDGVRSVAWSLLGKQLVAGLQDGTAVQMEPTGSPKAIIPRPPGVASDFEGAILPLFFLPKHANFVSVNYHLDCKGRIYHGAL